MVVGIDVSTPMLAAAQGKGTAVHLLQGDAAALPVATESFDLVFSATTLEFVAHPQRAVREMWRALRRGGRLVIAVLNALSPWAWARRLESRRQKTRRLPSPMRTFSILGSSLACSTVWAA
jgi:ubiquinone/menaquinone biosynthesis C-methylase UbiE